MQELVLLNRQEQERLIRAIEGGLYVQLLRQLFNWCQGAMSGLLPHGILVCVHLDENDVVSHLECLNAVPRNAEELRRLCDRDSGLVVRLVRHCREYGRLVFRFEGMEADLHGDCPALPRHGSGDSDPRSFSHQRLATDVVQQGLRNVLVHGTERVNGGSTFFALFEMSEPPSVRHEFYLSMLVPHLHLAFLRIIANRDSGVSAAKPALALSARELEVLSYLLAGKTNIEIGMILGLSALTIKNHLQKIYRKLNVSNRVQALARSHELKLFPMAGGKAAGAAAAPVQRRG
jgi:transcriptional regulator EpsA